jgi:hypothetical protein
MIIKFTYHSSPQDKCCLSFSVGPSFCVLWLRLGWIYYFIIDILTLYNIYFHIGLQILRKYFNRYLKFLYVVVL